MNNWSSGASLSGARGGSCSVTMADGRVLFAGGTSASGVVKSVDILGTNGAFAAGPAMLTGRTNAACALLPDGRVFVAGGNDGINALNSSEYYTPSTGVWTSAGTMHTGRYGHTATVDQYGAVILAGGRTANGSVSSQLEVFRPANNQFTVLGQLSSARMNYTIVTVDSRHTVIAGGSDGQNTLASIDVFDALTNTVTPGGNLLTARSGFGAGLLLDGRVLFTGGFDTNGSALASTEIYDPATRSVVAGPALNTARGNHQTYALPGNGGVMVFGGTNGTGALSSSEIYQTSTGKFTPVAAMSTPRTGASATIMRPGTVVIAGGQNGAGYLSGSEVYTYATVQTGKADYHPGDVASATGNGWKAGENVAIAITSVPAAGGPVTTEYTGSAVADGSGRISLSGFNIDKSHLGMKFLLTATGSESVSQTTFTDGTDATELLVGSPTLGSGYVGGCGSAANQPPVCSVPYGTTMTFVWGVRDVTNTGTTVDAGTVSLTDNNVSLYGNTQANCSNCTTNPVPNGQFVVQPNDQQEILSPGVNYFQLTYNGATDSTIPTPTTFLSSTTNSIQINVQSVTTFINITSPNQPTTYGSPVTLTATVTAEGSPSPLNVTFSLNPSGTVIFSDGAGNTCTANAVDPPLVAPATNAHYQNESVFSCLTPVSLPAGTHNFTASYSGVQSVWLSAVSNVPPSGPNSVQVSVTAVNTTTTLTATPSGSPQMYPQPMTMTAVVAPVAGSGPATGAVNFYDNGNDVCGVAVTLVAGSATSCQFIMAGGSHNLTASYTPGNTNFAASQSGATPFSISAQTTSTAVGLSSGSVALGANVTMTATVSCIGTNNVDCGTTVGTVTGEGAVVGTPQGTVNFIDVSNGNTVLNPAPIGVTASGTTSTASFSTTALGTGGHNIIAAFTPGTSTVLDWAASSSTLTPQLVTVGAISPTFNISITPPTTPTAYQALTFTVSANSQGGHIPTGTVALTVGTSTIATSQVSLNNGSATFNTSGVAAGTHTLSIAYVAAPAETNFSSNAAVTPTPGTFTVGATGTTTVVTSSQNSPILYGTNTTFTATVSPATTLAPGSPTPPGTVTFYDNSVAITGCSGVSVASGTAQCTPAAPLVAGPSSPHPITAIYTPTGSDFSTSTSAAFNMTVNPATTTTTVSSNVNTVNLGGSVVYTVSVQGTPAGAGNPTGTVTLTDNGHTLSPAGTVACPATGLSLTNPATECFTVVYDGSTNMGSGAHSVVAAFGGSTNFGTSTSSPITETVNAATTTINQPTVTISSNPATTMAYDDAAIAPVLTWTFSFGANPPNPTPTMPFQIYDGANLIGTQPVPAGTTASFNLPVTLAVGSHTFIVKYPTGDANYAAATSVGAAFTVTKFTDTVTASGFTAGSVAYGTADTVGGTVSNAGTVANPAPAPTGTLTFTFGTTTLGTCTLSGGSCTLGVTNAALVAGSDSIGIAYSGDSSYASATGTGTLTVGANTVSEAITTSPASPTQPSFGSPVVITVAFTASGAGSVGTPTGTATIYDQAPNTTPPPTSIGVVTLANGIAHLTTSSLVPGTHTFYATYSGDTNFAALSPYTSSPATSLTISNGNTTVTLTPSANPTALNQVITYTVTVTGGPSQPVGTVTLNDAIGGGGNISSCFALTLTPQSGNTSGVTCQVNYNATPGQPTQGAGSHPITATYTPTGGNASNWTSAVSPTVTEVVGMIAPTISQPTANPTPGNYGVPETYAVTLTPVNPTPAYGASTVQFYDNGVPLGGPVSVSNISTSTFTSGSTVPVGGQHSITAQFIGDGNYAASLLSAKLVFSIAKATPTVSIGAPFSLSSPYYGMIGTSANPIVVTVAVPGGNSGVTPTGSVSLMAGTTLLATGTLSSGGVANFMNVQLPATLGVNGSPYSFYATYGGDGNWATANSSSQNGSLTVTPASAPVVVTSSNSSPAFGQSVTLTATFNGPGNPVTGTISFLNGSGVISGCGNAAVANNVATCTTSILPVGADIISVSTSSTALDQNHILGAITTTTVTVGKDTTVTTLTNTVNSANPSVPGQAVSFTATITVPAPGNGTNTLNGTVTFTWGLTTPTTNILSTCTNMALSSNSSGASVTCAVPTNTAPFTNAGQYLVTATYSPLSSDNNTTSAATITQTVGKPGPTFTQLTSSANPSVYSAPVTFTVQFTTPGPTPPTGTIQFYDGANTLGGLQAITPVSGQTYSSTITIPSGSLPVLAAGNHTISAVYVPGNNDNYGSSNSATQNPSVILIQVVNQAGSNTNTAIAPATITYLSGSGLPNAPVYGEQVTFTATISPVAPATGVPTGYAIFLDAGQQIGPLEPVNNIGGVATVAITTSNGTVPNLQVGNHANITVKYLGDTNFTSSTSVAFTPLFISPAPTKTVLTNFPASGQLYGTQVTLTAQVCATQVNGPGAPTTNCATTPFPGLTGSIKFMEGATVLNPGGAGVQVDPNTGIASITFTLANPPLLNPVVGNHNITAVYSGDVDFQTSTSGPSVLNVVPGPTKSAVTASVNPIVIGQSVTFIGTVTAPNSVATALPTGTVVFMDGGVQIGTGALTNVGGVATVQFTVPNPTSGQAPLYPLSLGQHTIAISYSGDANYAPSATSLSPPPCAASGTQTCAIVENVGQASTTTSILSSSNGSSSGQQITLTATITVTPPGAAIAAGPSAGPTGTVVFTDNYAGSTNNVLGTGLVTKNTSNGLYQATLTIATLPTTITTVTATYSGDTNYIGSASPALNQSVSKLQSQINIISSANNVPLGTPVTYTINVSAISPGASSPIPTGNITLFDGSNVLSNLALTGSCGATCTSASYTAALPIGGHVLSASYPGDLNYQGTSGPTISAIVNKIQSTLNLTSSVPGGAVASQVITFTAQIQPNPPVGVAYPTGQIGFFMDGATQIGAASLASGVATLSTTLPAGNHQIQAFYIGDNNWSGAQSIYLAQVVGTATTTTQIVSSANPSVYGQAVVVTVTVAVPYPGTVPANGTVQLYDGGNAIGTPLPANNGTFSTTLSNLGVGTHSIVAQFQANGSFGQSSSAALSQIVNKAPTVTTLAAFPNSSTSNQSVTLTAVVTVPSPGSTAASAPSGTVQFVNTTTSAVLGSAPLTLVGGVWTATLNVTSLTQGSQNQFLTATYSGDGNFATSTSQAQPMSVFGTEITVVNAAGYTTTNFAPNSFAAIFGSNLAYTALTANVTPWPSSLSGTTVTVTDSAGTARLAPLYYVSLSQINFVIPANTAYGLANVTVTNASGETASTVILITVTSPGLYSENSSGQGVAAGYLLTAHADGTQSPQSPLFQYNPNSSQYVAIPIVWNNSTDQQFLVLYGTGIRNAAQNAVTATMNGISVPVLYAGAQAQFIGEDQINLGPIPTSLKGAGTVNIVITVNGQASNTVTVTIQ